MFASNVAPRRIVKPRGGPWVCKNCGHPNNSYNANCYNCLFERPKGR